MERSSKVKKEITQEFPNGYENCPTCGDCRFSKETGCLRMLCDQHHTTAGLQTLDEQIRKSSFPFFEARKSKVSELHTNLEEYNKSLHSGETAPAVRCRYCGLNPATSNEIILALACQKSPDGKHAFERPLVTLHRAHRTRRNPGSYRRRHIREVKFLIGEIRYVEHEINEYLARGWELEGEPKYYEDERMQTPRERCVILQQLIRREVIRETDDDE